MKVLGMISGTSHDGIDMAYVGFRLADGDLHAHVIRAGSVPYEAGLRARLVAALPPASTTMEEVARLDGEIGQAFADAASDLLAGEQPDLVVSHGQTVFHWVEDGQARSTLQIGQGAFIAEAVGAPVLADVRIADVAAGGHGAPLVPLMDDLLWGHEEAVTALVNLGGIANVTIVGGGRDPLAYDVGPANALIDAAVLRHGLHPAGYDEDGIIAASGLIDQTLLDALLADDYYRVPPPRSTGKEHFNDDYLVRQVEGCAPGILPEDLVATVTELTAVTVAQACLSHGLERVLVAGGGAANPVLQQRMAHHLGEVELATTDGLGVPVDLKEAIAFALIGWHSAHGLPGARVTATGARGARVLGAWHPGPHGQWPGVERVDPPQRLVIDP